MIGYHYTTEKNWRRIQKYGLMPYENFPFIFGKTETVVGIWLWQRKPRGKNHLGNIMRVISKHKEVRVVLLKCRYSKRDVYRYLTRPVSFLHEGTIGDWVYHKRFPARICQQRILPKNIELVDYYDMEKAVNEK